MGSPRTQDAVDIGFVKDLAEAIGYFGRADILALPAEGVAEAVREEEMTVLVFADQLCKE
jgi:hypothetical protein